MTRVREDFGFADDVEERSGVTRGYIFRSGWEHRPLGFRFQTEKHGGISTFITYEELARLLTREDIDRLDAEMRRQQRHSGVESLAEISGWNEAEYADLTE